MNNTKYIRELAKVCVWDINDTSLTPHVDINPTKINHIGKRMVQEMGREEEFTKLSGDTLYKTLAAHVRANVIGMILGEISVDTMLELTEKGIQTNDMYPPFEEDVEKFIQVCRGFQEKINEIGSATSEVTLPTFGTLTLPEDGPLTAINALLTDSKLPTLEDTFSGINSFNEELGTLKEELKGTKESHKKLEEDLDRVKAEVGKLTAAAMAVPTFSEYHGDEKKEIPNGKVATKLASEIFGVPLMQDMEVPYWEWDGEHPDVPAIDEHYIFRPKHLQRALYAIVTNQREYIQGHTGSGKTTLVEQIAARLNWPFIRINFDSEITRMDLIGRDTLTHDVDTGKVVSVFEDGMLPTAMSGPYICCFDELDFVRPDVAYVMQAALEGNGLRITEDGDRLVTPHPMFRMFGTGNTVGQGDEDGMYQGARPQSIAFLDRFTIWDRIDYLSEEERDQLVSHIVPSLGEADRKALMQYTREHLEAFTQSKVIQPISPRGILAVAKATVMLGSLKEALEMTVIDRANKEDRAVLKGLVDRVTK